MDISKTIKEAIKDVDNINVEYLKRDYTIKNPDNAKDGQFCIAFQMESKDKGKDDLCLRVFKEIPSNIERAKDRFNTISKALKESVLPYFEIEHFSFVEDVLTVDNKKLHAVICKWVKGLPLNDFLIISYQRNPKSFQEVVRQIASSFLEMCYSMREKGIAHGDLSNSNIMITSKNEIKLIDYDSVFVPSMKGKGFNQVTGGAPGYQHPDRLHNCREMLASKDDDNFSQWVIYLSLLAISYDTSLYERIDNDMLFTNRDFEDPDKFVDSTGYRMISKIPQLKEHIDRFSGFIEGELKNIPSIVDYFPRPKRERLVKIDFWAGYCGACGHHFSNQTDLFCPECGKKRETLRI